MNKTKVIYLHGAPAVGKLTTAKKLCEHTEYKLLHNHLTTDLVRAVFERGNSKGDMLIVKLRFELLELAVQEQVAGIVVTGAHAHNYRYPNGESDDWYAQQLELITERNGGEFYGVHLTATEEQLFNRVTNPDRTKWGKISTHEILQSSIRINDFTKPADVKKLITIDNTNKTVEEVSNLVMDFIK